MAIWIIISLVIAIADQIIKYLVIQNISSTEMIEVIPDVLNFIYVKNTGAAFSILSGKTDILSVISLAVCIFLVFYLIKKKKENKLFIISLGMMLGGALGNLIDRLFRSFVVDYIELSFINFPVFNLADIAITLGAILLMVYMIFFDGKSK